MPYLKCPNCGLLAHVIATNHTALIHCPRCRALQQNIQLTPLEDRRRHLSGSPEQQLKPAR